MNITKLTNQEIRQELRKIVKEYINYPSEFTVEIMKSFEKRAKPLMNEINKRMVAIWERSGSTIVAKKPLQINFKNIVEHGI